MLDITEVTPADRKALNKCLTLTRADEQIKAKLEECGWREASEFACYILQTSALNLKPWQSPPCWNNEDDPKSIALLDKMLAAGLSQYEPDPLAALKRKQRQ